MEDTLRVNFVGKKSVENVLILVLMEDTLRDAENFQEVDIDGLNPCFNGRYSQRRASFFNILFIFGLNPCFNGRYSQSKDADVKNFDKAS